MSDQPTTANPPECPAGYAPGEYLCGDGKWRPCLVGEPITEVDIIRPGWARPERTPIAHARLVRLRAVGFAWAALACGAVVRLRRRPLRDQVTYWRDLWMKENVERLRLKDAIEITLRQNAHLADGDVCTLKLLKDSIREPNDKIQPTCATGGSTEGLK